MRREDYKRLGEYIAPYLEKNVGLKVSLSQGISNNKYFQTPRQVAVDSENDQIVRTGQFAYNKATTRNGEKISIAYREGPDCTVSSAYQVFYIKDEEKLNPYYLLMWFKRPEFDRYARFKSFGSAHEFFTWEEMCNVYLPVPDINEQRKIVAEYQTVLKRIENNKRFIKALESTAQAIYYHTFVENIDPENLPEGWRKGTLGDFCDTQYGYTETATSGTIGPKFLRITDIVKNSIDWAQVPYCPISDVEYKKYKLELGDIVVSRTGANVGWAKQIKGNIPEAVFASFLIRIKTKEPIYQWLIGYLVESEEFKQFVSANQRGSAQPQANANVLVKYPIRLPDKELLEQFNKKILVINGNISLVEQENSKLTELQSLFLAKMGN